MRKILLSLFVFMHIFESQAQLNIGGKPLSIEQNLEFDHIDTRVMPSFDSQRMLNEDRNADKFKTGIVFSNFNNLYETNNAHKEIMVSIDKAEVAM